MIRWLLILLLLIFTKFSLHTQAPYGSFYDIKVLPNLDTVFLDRSYGDWWFGVFANGAYNINFGQLQIPERPYLPLSDTLNRLLRHRVKDGFNTKFGIITEYVPKGSHWGAVLKMTFLEKRNVESLFSFSDKHQYFGIFDFRTIVFSPSVRYNFAIEGLHCFAGIDIEYLFDNRSKLREIEYNVERIVTDWVLPSELKKLRFGLHIGAGWDILVLDIAKTVRVRAKPFINLQYGTVFFDGYSSRLNTFFVQGGFAVVLGPDDITREYRKYDSTYVKPPGAIAQAPPTLLRPGVIFEGFEREIHFAALELALVERPEFVVEVGLTAEEKLEGEVSVQEPTPKIKFEPNQKVVLQGFPRPDVTSLTSSMRNTLDALAEFLLSNPEYTVIIEGHSDNQGTLVQNTERGRLRAEAAANYLIMRKVSPNRIRTGSRSSFFPIADNASEEGRRRNRRVEILLKR
ncbi:MAG: OmpA family protein [Ignavibacteria bacterium]|nr:OmpA family protein [Ignavibacteria bacterium]